MLIGTIFLGKVKELDKQSIQTKFFIFILPIYPIESILVKSSPSVNKRHGMLLPELDKKSVFAGYTRLTVLCAAIIVSIFGWRENGIILGITVLLLLVWAYLTFIYGKPTEEEIIIRRRVGNATGFLALGEWMDEVFIHENFPIVELNYKTNFRTQTGKRICSKRQFSRRSDLCSTL